MRQRVGEILVAWGAITQEDLRHCLVMQSQDPPRRRRRLGRILLDEERVTEISLAAALAQAHGLRSVDLSQEEIDTDVARSIPQVVAMKALVVPLSRRDNVLRVAAADPVDVTAVTVDAAAWTGRTITADVRIVGSAGLVPVAAETAGDAQVTLAFDAPLTGKDVLVVVLHAD